MEHVVVTGTRIQKSNLASVSPITQISGEDIQMTGQTRLEDVLRDLPQVYAVENTTISNEAAGTATVNLRNLGTNRTLVLVDGRRLPQGSPYTPRAADINQIPVGLVERVEVLTGGASAVYGADALAGVINFFLVDNYEGIQLDYQFSSYSHDNDDNTMARRLEAAGEPAPSGTDRDGDTHNISLMLGRNFDRGRGNLTGYLTYRDIDPISLADRDYSACPLGRGDDGFVCSGSQTIAEGLFDATSSPDLMVQGDEFVAWDGRRYNYNPPNYFQREDERWSAGLNGHYEFGEQLTVYTQLSYTDDDTTGQIAPGGTFGVEFTLSCDNPMLSPQQFDVLCADAGLGAGDSLDVDIWRRSVEGRPRQQQTKHESWRVVAGLEGRLSDAWRYDLYALYSEVDLDSTYREELLYPNVARALDAATDPGTGDIVCESNLDGSDPDCSPWNIFTEGAVTMDALDYISTPLSDDGSTELTVIAGYLAANLSEYGLVSPFADTGIDLVIGAEYRDEDLEISPDTAFTTGSVLGFGTRNDLEGGYDVLEFYTEAILPLAEGRPWLDSLELEMGYRYSDYSDWDDTDTYKLGASWQPMDSLRFRFSYQRAERIPNVQELYTPVSDGFDFFVEDPCAGGSPTRSFEDCAASGVTEEQYGAIPEPGIDFVRTVSGGNTELQPETSDTYSVGLIYSPSFLQNTTFSLDWYEIKIEDAISGVGGSELVLDFCLDSGDPAVCRLVNRESESGTLWRDDANIDVRQQNIGYIRTRGYDFILDAGFDAGPAGSFLISNILTWVDEWKIQGTPATETIDCEGRYSGNCPFMHELRNYLRVNWVTPWDITLSALWRHFDDLEHYERPRENIDSYDYIDLALTWDATDRTRLRLGINNVFDEDPPIVVNGHGNTAGGIYDALGQYWFAGLTVNF
jgi:outer membrane receptor protein involved in Fe transport